MTLRRSSSALFLRSLAAAAAMALGACGPLTQAGHGVIHTPQAPPALPDHGRSYAHRVMSQAGFTFADVETPDGAPKWSTVFGFMPAGMAETGEAARAGFDAQVVAALAKALHAADLGDHGIRPEPLVLDPTMGRPVTSLRFDITGGPCEDAGTRCAYAAPIIDLPGVAPAPPLSGVDGQAWWVGSRWFGPAVTSKGTGRVPLFPDLALWQVVTLDLPDWAFVYLAPGTAVYRDDATGQYRFNAWPLLVQDGCVYRFGPRGSPVRKKPEVRTAAR